MVFGGNMAPDFNTDSYCGRASNADMAAARDIIIATGASGGLLQQALVPLFIGHRPLHFSFSPISPPHTCRGGPDPWKDGC